MKTKVVLTVDTEPSIAGAFEDPTVNQPLLHEPVWGEVGGRSEALGFLIRTLVKYQLVATFFVETVHTRYFSADIMGRYVEELVKAGQDVQLHIHPCWASFTGTDFDPANMVSDNCSDLSVEQLTDLITQGADQIEQWTGKRPTGMRTGNFATSLSVFEAMKRAGLKNASNICVAGFMPPEEELSVTSGTHRFADIQELPVTCFADHGPIGRGRLRPMQITALSAAEQIALLNDIHAQQGGVAMIVTHPFEFLKTRNFRYEGMRPNRLVQRRLETLCAFLDANRDRFEMVPLGVAAQADTGATAPKLDGSPWRATVRAAGNFINDRFL